MPGAWAEIGVRSPGPEEAGRARNAAEAGSRRRRAGVGGRGACREFGRKRRPGLEGARRAGSTSGSRVSVPWGPGRAGSAGGNGVAAPRGLGRVCGGASFQRAWPREAPIALRAALAQCWPRRAGRSAGGSGLWDWRAGGRNAGASEESRGASGVSPRADARPGSVSGTASARPASAPHPEPLVSAPRP